MQSEAIRQLGECIKQGDPVESVAAAVGVFIVECGEMAEKNWLPSQVDMLERLFGAVLHNCEYADYDPKRIEND